jgi:hypothetical protein
MNNVIISAIITLTITGFAYSMICIFPEKKSSYNYRIIKYDEHFEVEIFTKNKFRAIKNFNNKPIIFYSIEEAEVFLKKFYI